MINRTIKGERKTSSLREFYYISESWDPSASFHSQDESNRLVEDLESITSCLREDLHLYPEQDGARIMGDLVIEEKRRDGNWMRMNCRKDVGDAGYLIPKSVE
jgi:DNA topoisomerase-6 subunit A